MKNLDINSLLGLSETELLTLIANDLEEGEHVLPSNMKALIRKSEIWVKNKSNELQNIICQNQNIKNLVRGDSSETDIIAALIDVIAPYVIGISPATLAVLLFKKGMKSYCSVYYESN